KARVANDGCSGDAETSVETSVGRVARDGKAILRWIRTGCVAPGDELSVRLKDDSGGPVAREGARRHGPAAAEARVEASVRVVAREDGARVVMARDDEFAVRLEDERGRAGVPTDCGPYLAAAAERCVEAPVRVVANQGDVVVGPDA